MIRIFEEMAIYLISKHSGPVSWPGLLQATTLQGHKIPCLSVILFFYIPTFIDRDVGFYLSNNAFYES